MQKVVILGSNDKNTLGLIRSVGMNGCEVHVILEPCNPKFCNLRFSRYIKSFRIASTADEVVEIMIREFADEDNPTPVLCGSDRVMVVLDKRYNELKEKFFTFNVRSSDGEIAKLMEKTATFHLAKEAGFDIIRTWDSTTPGFNIEDVTFPCLVKGSDSTKSSKKDMVVCHDRSVLKHALQSDSSLIIQEFIQSGCELNIVGLSVNNGEKVFIHGAKEKLRQTFEEQGQYLVLKPFNDFSGVDFGAVNRLLQKIGYNGLFSVEVIHCEGKIYFLEINLRNDGTTWVDVQAGVNYPMAWVEHCLGQDISYISNIVIPDKFYAIQITDISSILHRKVSPIKWIKQFLGANTFYVLWKRDLIPFFYQLYIPARQLATKPFRLMRKVWDKINSQSECFNYQLAELYNYNGNRPKVSEKPLLRAHRPNIFSIMHPPIMQADPFMFVKGDTLFLFYEEMLFEKGLGKIMMHSTKDLHKWTSPVQISHEDSVHFSYPFVFQDVVGGGGVYLLPETGCDHNIRLYKADDENLTSFKPYKILLERSNTKEWEGITFDWADSCIVFHNGKHYLFTSLLRDDVYELELYLSDNFDGPYIPHPQNPVATGNEIARCGGAVFWHEGKIYRPAQDCSTNYGGQLHLYEITELTPAAYSERKVRSNIIPQHQQFFRQGGHHLNMVEFMGRTVVAMDARFTTSFLLERIRFKIAKKFSNDKYKNNFE